MSKRTRGYTILIRLCLIHRFGLCVLLTLLTRCSFLGGTTTHSQLPSSHKNQVAVLAGSSAPIDTVADQVLHNMQLHSWNPNARTHNKVTGGLFINWKMDNPQVTNTVRPNADGNP